MLQKLQKEVKIDLIFLKDCGIIWGSSSDVLATVYKSYIRLVLDYGGELLATASESCCDLVDKVQNKALRLITSAALAQLL